MVSNDGIILQLLGLATSGLMTLFGLGLAVIGLVYIRRVNTIAGLCMAGAGLLSVIGSFIRRLVSVLFSFVGGSVFTISQVLTTLLSIAAGLLIPLSIFLLASSIKQNTGYR